MDAFLKYLYQDMGLILKSFVGIFVSFFDFLNTMLNFPMRMRIFQSHAQDFNITSWVLGAVFNFLLLAIIAILLFFFAKVILMLFYVWVLVKGKEKLRKEVGELEREIFNPHVDKR